MKTTIEINDNIATIDGKTYKLTEIEKKEPSWEEVFKGGKHLIGWDGGIRSNWTESPDNRLLTERSVKKAVTFHKLLALADYLNEGWVPDWEDHSQKWFIGGGGGSFDVISLLATNRGTPPFKSEELALRAIDIFRANGDEQELIDFFTK